MHTQTNFMTDKPEIFSRSLRFLNGTFPRKLIEWSPLAARRGAIERNIEIETLKIVETSARVRMFIFKHIRILNSANYK